MNKFRLNLIPLMIASTFGIDAAHAEDFDNRFYIAPMGSYVLSDNDRHTKDAYGGTLAFGKRIAPYLEVEALGTYLHYGKKNFTERGGLFGGEITRSNKETIYDGGLGINILMAPHSTNFERGFFIHADVQEGKKFLYNAGVGYDLPLGLTFGGRVSGFAIRAEALYHHQKGYEEPQFNLGFRIPFGTLAPPVEAPEPPVTIVPVQQPGPPPPPPPPPPCEAPSPGQPMTLEGCKVGDTIVLRGVNFDFDKASLTLNAKALLDQVADALKARGDIKVELDGHTDGKGSDAYNQKLSDRRAASVLAYLTSRGVDAGRMTARGFGESMPIADNATDEGRELNRRVALKVLEANGGAGAVEVAPTVVPTSSAVEPAATPTPTTSPEPPPPAPAVTASGTAVSISNFAFAPASLTVTPGTTVTWTNMDSASHAIKFQDEESGVLSEGASYTKTFAQPGTYSYKCGIHSAMTGTIVVQ